MRSALRRWILRHPRHRPDKHYAMPLLLRSVCSGDGLGGSSNRDAIDESDEAGGFAEDAPAITASHQKDATSDEDDFKGAIAKRLHGTGPKQLRKPPVLAPTTHLETWVPASLVSDIATENVLHFRTRYFMTSQAEQPPEWSKVFMRTHVSKLGLAPLEMNRLKAVAGQRYDHQTDVLRLTSQTYAEPHRNKAEIRLRLASLMEDARANAKAHAHADQASLPLAHRNKPWYPDSHGARHRLVSKRRKPQRARTYKP